MAKEKVVSMEEAMKHCFDGMTIMLPGFVNCGVPQTLIKGLVGAGIKDLNVISNNTSVKGKGSGLLVHDDLIEEVPQRAGVGEIRGLVLLLHESEEVGGPHERTRDQSIEHIESDDFRRLGCLLVFRGLHDEHLSYPYAQQSNKRVPRDRVRGERGATAAPEAPDNTSFRQSGSIGTVRPSEQISFPRGDVSAHARARERFILVPR